jgi:hypothetical protein
MTLHKSLLLIAASCLLPTFLLNAQTAVQSPAATWVMVAPESSTIAAVLPAGTTYRFGDTTNNKWSATITVTVATTFSPVSFTAGVFPFSDPDTGFVKELDVLETSVPQAITLTNLAVSPTTSVSQMVPPLVAPAAVPVIPGEAYTLTFSNFSTAPTTLPNGQMLAFVNAPSSLAYRTWEGTQMNLTIDGVVLVCTYAQTYTDQVFTLACSVPAAAPAAGQ